MFVPSRRRAGRFSKRQIRWLLLGMVAVLLDQIWFSTLFRISPSEPGPKSGQIVLLHRHVRHTSVVHPFYVYPAQAYIHYGLSTFGILSVACSIFLALTLRFRKQD
jgi:hypothetical protein